MPERQYTIATINRMPVRIHQLPDMTHTIAHHLRIAALRYRKDAEQFTAKDVHGPVPWAYAGLERQFIAQADQCDRLAEEFENASAVYLRA